MKAMKVKSAKTIIKSGELAVWSNFDGRYSSTETIVRVVDYNTDSNEYLVKLQDKSWQVVASRELSPVEI